MLIWIGHSIFSASVVIHCWKRFGWSGNQTNKQKTRRAQPAAAAVAAALLFFARCCFLLLFAFLLSGFFLHYAAARHQPTTTTTTTTTTAHNGGDTQQQQHRWRRDAVVALAFSCFAFFLFCLSNWHGSSTSKLFYCRVFDGKRFHLNNIRATFNISYGDILIIIWIGC